MPARRLCQGLLLAVMPVLGCSGWSDLHPTQGRVTHKNDLVANVFYLTMTFYYFFVVALLAVTPATVFGARLARRT